MSNSKRKAPSQIENEDIVELLVDYFTFSRAYSLYRNFIATNSLRRKAEFSLRWSTLPGNDTSTLKVTLLKHQLCYFEKLLEMLKQKSICDLERMPFNPEWLHVEPAFLLPRHEQYSQDNSSPKRNLRPS